MTLYDTLRTITPLNYQAMRDAQSILDAKVKPSGSLGTLENIAVHLAGITGSPRAAIKHKTICLFGSDHGIYAEGVCSSPQDFTRQLMHVYADSQDGGINILSRQAGAELRLYDLGVKGLAHHKNIITRKFMPCGTNNFLRERAMPHETAEKVITFGIDIVREMKAQGVDLIGTGEVGMGNTTPACACIMAATGSRDLSLVGRGAGLTDEAYSRKQRVIQEALAFHAENFTDQVNILSCVGGLDIAAMAGVFLGGAVYHVPVIIDGVISIAGAVLASLLAPLAREYMLASHESPEPAFVHAVEFMNNISACSAVSINNENASENYTESTSHTNIPVCGTVLIDNNNISAHNTGFMNLTPPLKLGMRLGEGTGCAVFMHIIDDALAIINEMGDFSSLTKGD